MKVLWFSVDPRSGGVSLYSATVAARIESAFVAHRPSAPLNGLGGYFEGATIEFNNDGHHLQRTATGKRDVRREEVPAESASFTVYVTRERGWRIADFHAPPLTQERQLDISRGDAALPKTKAFSSSSSAPSFDREEKLREDESNGLVGLWEWCRLAEPPSVESVPSEQWGVYAQAQNELIEDAFRRGCQQVKIELGIREYDILFDGPTYSRQVDRTLKKRRHVRRRAVRPEEREFLLECNVAATNATADEDSCPICCSTFAETPTLPVVQLSGCMHRFHGACAQQLADKRDVCPLCRGPADWRAAFGMMMRQ